MKRTGIADTPLHGGRAPRWLFQRMQRLARQLILTIVEEHDTRELLHRVSDPHWFQAFGSVLGFDWHSSGVTTTVCGAMKEGIRGIEEEIGFFAAGGKGKASLRTPDNIRSFGHALRADVDALVHASRMSAKVDNAGLQDGFTIYHHAFFFTPDGSWAVVQQGMNDASGYARRYHWRSDGLECFTREPHAGIWAARRETEVLNLVAREGEEARRASADLGREHPDRLLRELDRIQSLRLPARHEILARDIHPDRIHKILLRTYEAQHGDFEGLLGMRGVGPKTLRALALLSEVVYGARVSFRDPARFSYAHGGKDGIPYPVDRQTYDRSIEILKQALDRARIGDRDKIEAFRRLSKLERSTPGRQVDGRDDGVDTAR